MNKPLRVLIVENCEDDALLLLKYLKQYGYSPIYDIVDNESGFEKALDIDEWDIVIANYILPELSGLEVLHLLQEKDLDIPCLIISSKISDEIAVSSIRAGARDYIMKDTLERIGPAIERELSELKTRRKHQKAEVQVKRGLELIEKIFNSMAEGAILWSSDLTILKANAEAGRIFKLPGIRLEGQSYNFSEPAALKTWNWVRPDGSVMPDEERTAYLALKEKREIKNLELGLKWPDRSVTWLHTSAALVLNEQNTIEGVITTFTDVTEQKQLRDENESFTRKLLEVQEEERKRVAQELHDDTAQNLALLMLEIDNILLNDKELPPESFQRLERLKEDVERTQRDVRRYSHELRPGVLDYLGLEAALESLVEDINSRGRIEAHLELKGTENRLPNEIELALFRIAQEALNNIRKHAGATKAKIQIKYSPDKVTLSISDNGKGFKPSLELKRGFQGGLGLTGMRERAQIIGASLKIKSIPGKGTTVSAQVPQ